jgi:hypothetical protein
VAYWVNRHQNRLYAADLSGVPTGDPIVEPWESLNLSATGGGFTKYAGEFALLLHANRLWLPEPDVHSALVVDALYGVRAVATGFTQVGQRLLGSVGSFAVQLGAETAAFTNFGTNPAGKGGIFGVQSEAPFAASWEQWQASVPFNAASGDFQHPVSLLFSRAGQTWSCVVASTVQAFSATLGLQGGLRISGVSDKDGSVCGDGVLNQWGTNDGAYAGTYLMVNEFTANATWASAPSSAALRVAHARAHALSLNRLIVRRPPPPQPALLLAQPGRPEPLHHLLGARLGHGRLHGLERGPRHGQRALQRRARCAARRLGQGLSRHRDDAEQRRRERPQLAAACAHAG